MPGDFDARMAELEEQVKGHWQASTEVDQVYAHYQHEGLEFEHPRGGQAKYLEQPWEAGASGFSQRWADGLLKPEGLKEAATAIAQDGVRMVDEHAPVEFENLKHSGHGAATRDGAVIYDEPPLAGRLSETELKALSHAQDEGLDNHYRGDWT